MKTRSSKKQTRLSFEPVASTSPSVNSYSPAVQGRLANVRFQGARSSPKHSQRNAVAEERNLLPTPEPSSQPHTTIEKDSSPLSDAPSTPNKIASEFNNLHEHEQTDEDEIVVPSSKRRRIDNAVAFETPTRKSTRLRAIDTPQSNVSLRSKPQRMRITSSPPASKAISIGSAETSGDEEETLFTKPTTRCRGSRSAHKDDPFVVSDDDQGDEQVVPRARSRKKSQVVSDFVVDDNEIEYLSSEQEGALRQKHQRSSKNKRRSRSRKEQDELEDDLQNLQDSDQEDVVETRRTRGGPVTTQRDRNREHFDLLKRRRAGEPVPRIIDSDDENDPAFDENDGVDLEQITTTVRRPSTWSKARQEYSDTDGEDAQEPQQVNDDAYEDDFVVDDESQPSRHVTAGIPLAFTSFASRKPRELFVHVVEWLIKNKIAPAFSRDDELYVLSWNKINDQIKAQAGSRLISSAWNEDFKNAILARPQMQVHLVTEGYDEFFLNCDACNRTNHPARYEFQFTGQSYHKDTLEPIDDGDSNDEDDDAGDGASYDQQGHLLPSANRTYNLGRFCAANAEMGHKLTHWKHHLNQSLLEYLEEQGILSAEAIVAREKLNKKKREKEAENIVDLMQETGMVDQLWRGLQDDLEDARFGMEDHVAKGGRRNQQRIGKVRVDRGNGRTEEWSEGGRMKLVIGDDSEGE